MIHIWFQQQLPITLSDEAGEASFRECKRLLPLLSTDPQSRQCVEYSLNTSFEYSFNSLFEYLLNKLFPSSWSPYNSVICFRLIPLKSSPVFICFQEGRNIDSFLKMYHQPCQWLEYLSRSFFILLQLIFWWHTTNALPSFGLLGRCLQPRNVHRRGFFKEQQITLTPSSLEALVEILGDWKMCYAFDPS